MVQAFVKGRANRSAKPLLNDIHIKGGKHGHHLQGIISGYVNGEEMQINTTDKLRMISLLYLLAGVLAILVPIIYGISMSDADSGAGAVVCLIMFVPVIVFYIRLALNAHSGDIRKIKDNAAMGLLFSGFILFVVLNSLRKSAELDVIFIVLIIMMLVTNLIISIGTLIMLRGDLSVPVKNQRPLPVRPKTTKAQPKQTQSMYCGFCGKQKPHGAIYCPNCGKKSFDEGNK